MHIETNAPTPSTHPRVEERPPLYPTAAAPGGPETRSGSFGR